MCVWESLIIWWKFRQPFIMLKLFRESYNQSIRCLVFPSAHSSTTLTLVCELTELNSSMPLVSVAQCKMLFRCEKWKITGLTLTSQDLSLSPFFSLYSHPPSLLLVLCMSPLSLAQWEMRGLICFLKAGFSGEVSRGKRGCVSKSTQLITNESF